MSEELLDAPEPIETESLNVSTEVETADEPVVEEEPKAEEASDSSTDKELTQSDINKVADKLTRKRRAAERDRDYWREQAMKQQPEVPEPVVETAKTLADFDYNEAQYQQHLIAQVEQRAVEKAKQVLRQDQQREAETRRRSVFTDRESNFSKELDDYDEVARNPSLSISQPMADVITDMDDGPAVLYYLGKNPSIADNIAQLPPLVAARELGRIEVGLSAKGANKVSKAPAPTPKISAAEPAIQKSVDEMSQKEFNEYRRKQIANRGR